MLTMFCTDSARENWAIAHQSRQTCAWRGVRARATRLSFLAVLIVCNAPGLVIAQSDTAITASPIERGRELFVRQWKIDDEQTPKGDGFGPTHNAAACVDCYNQGGTGDSGDLAHNVDLLNLIPRAREGIWPVRLWSATTRACNRASRHTDLARIQLTASGASRC